MSEALRLPISPLRGRYPAGQWGATTRPLRGGSGHDHLHPRHRRRSPRRRRNGRLAEEAPLEILGHGSKRGIGRPLQAEHTLDLSQLSGVTLYEPEELVLSAKAGTPLAEIEALLAERPGARLRADGLWPAARRRSAGSGTIGGVLAANLSGPRRLKAGAARDHILGIAGGVRARRGVQVGRPRGQERHRLRPVQADGRLLGHAGRASPTSPSRCCPPPRPRRRWLSRGLLDDDAAGRHGAGHGLERRGVGRRPSAAKALPRASPAARSAATPRRCCASRVRAVGRLPHRDSSKDLLGRRRPARRDLEARPRARSGARSATARPSPTAASGRCGACRWRRREATMVLALRMEAGRRRLLRLAGRPDLAAHGRRAGSRCSCARLVRQYRRRPRDAGARQPGRSAPRCRCSSRSRAALAALSARLKAQFDPKAILNPGRMA